jgi:flagellar basal-body rod protein FlgC
VQVLAVQSDPAPPIRRYDPGNPNADAKGYVSFPNISPVAEMTDLMEAVRSYQLNVSAVQATKNMLQQSISLLR